MAKKVNVSDSPKEIFLVLGELSTDVEFHELSGVSWCDEKVDKNDIKYIREDLVIEMINSSKIEK